MGKMRGFGLTDSPNTVHFMVCGMEWINLSAFRALASLAACMTLAVRECPSVRPSNDRHRLLPGSTTAVIFYPRRIAIGDCCVYRRHRHTLGYLLPVTCVSGLCPPHFVSTRDICVYLCRGRASNSLQSSSYYHYVHAFS